jgi:hypothetical protein
LATSKINDLHAIRVSHFYFVGLCRRCVGIFCRWMRDRDCLLQVFIVIELSWVCDGANLPAGCETYR